MKIKDSLLLCLIFVGFFLVFVLPKRQESEMLDVGSDMEPSSKLASMSGRSKLNRDSLVGGIDKINDDSSAMKRAVSNPKCNRGCNTEGYLIWSPHFKTLARSVV